MRLDIADLVLEEVRAGRVDRDAAIRILQGLRTQQPVGYRLPVRLGGISFIAAPLIRGILSMELSHIFIAVCFCKNRSSRNRPVFHITFYHAAMGDITEGTKTVAIHQNIFRGCLQPSQCPMHRLYRSP